jgi:hypothetical protein
MTMMYLAVAVGLQAGPAVFAGLGMSYQNTSRENQAGFARMECTE